MSTLTNNITNVTAEQLASMPEDGQRRELIYGVIKMMSPAGGRHGQVAHRLGRLLGNFVEPADLGSVFAAFVFAVGAIKSKCSIIRANL